MGFERIAVPVAVPVEWAAFGVVALAVAAEAGVLAGVVASGSAGLKTAVVVLLAQVAVVGTAGFVAALDIVVLGPVVVGRVAY